MMFPVFENMLRPLLNVVGQLKPQLIICFDDILDQLNASYIFPLSHAIQCGWCCHLGMFSVSGIPTELDVVYRASYSLSETACHTPMSDTASHTPMSAVILGLGQCALYYLKTLPFG